MDPSAARALRLADRAVADGSPHALALWEKAVELCDKTGNIAHLPFARALRQLCSLLIDSLTGLASTALRHAERALVVLSALDESSAEVLAEMAKSDLVRSIALGELGRNAESLLACQLALYRFDMECVVDEPGTINALNQEGLSLQKSGLYGESLIPLLRAETRALAAPRGDVIYGFELSVAASTLALSYICLGRLEEARQILRHIRRNTDPAGRRRWSYGTIYLCGTYF